MRIAQGIIFSQGPVWRRTNRTVRQPAGRSVAIDVAIQLPPPGAPIQVGVGFRPMLATTGCARPGLETPPALLEPRAGPAVTPHPV